ncbi:peptidoglycan DD-metalloendopeptidase family protein [Campylobacter sp. RM9344]|uniref:Peptidoglycan DD-metalloendopeptidase family protein n=1 Tax=Campylobacter californiensis TaxID=1032243 RepID=A0AAW3ZRC3_9BACT|nr:MULTISPECIES: peptidoglycan DD-metalloendopeptidase family protein [unclassified Campylobacter]MBE2983919.1 peptidoglycan DD-metalloendopeptidase family protein [Campylobacter sp. RM6883]MBE2986081.1 peptidoglycan DD-metalloendopeptidase family protein [Campylobacter sp. RM12919]MBE2987494.1 peptidoglycan DD-metalloendopeptidase family protein [Campylobacter sp. RM12920]MBE2994457.1 peptidoglycan DD-metalloendopeptidase family protein [Campylobacter sp. RM6913]MBE3028765.1 peptidoglycan DD-
MLRAFTTFLLLFINLYAINPTVEELSWPNGISFLNFLENNKMPLSLFYELSSEDKELAAEIIAGTKYQILKDKDQNTIQVLVPVSDELQLHIFRDKKDNFSLEFIPISYQSYDKVVNISIQKSLSEDLFDYTGSASLGIAIRQIFKGEDIDFKKLQKGDRIVVVYNQKIRMGKPFNTPEIYAAMIETRNKRYTMYKFEDKFYDKNGKKNDKFLLVRPLLNARITSPFTTKRFHPILQRYRAHLGVDYGAPRGTPIRSAGDGTVKFVGTKSGYGKVVIIKHAGGYETLYAHVNGFAKGLKTGQSVKQGALIAYVGSSGLSTGPHLHFGLYQSNKPINPESALKTVKSVTNAKEMAKFKGVVSSNDALIKKAIAQGETDKKFEFFPNIIEF